MMRCRVALSFPLPPAVHTLWSGHAYSVRTALCRWFPGTVISLSKLSPCECAGILSLPAIYKSKCNANFLHWCFISALFLAALRKIYSAYAQSKGDRDTDFPKSETPFPQCLILLPIMRHETVNLVPERKKYFVPFQDKCCWGNRRINIPKKVWVTQKTAGLRKYRSVEL